MNEIPIHYHNSPSNKKFWDTHDSTDYLDDFEAAIDDFVEPHGQARHISWRTDLWHHFVSPIRFANGGT
jgi:hypothetical protein